MMKLRALTPLHSALSCFRVLISKFYLVLLFQILSVYSPVMLYGQIDSLAEIISEATSDQTEIDALIEEFAGKPLNINSATRAELEYFSFLTPAQIDSIFESRPFIHKSALQGILGRQIFRLFAPFFTVTHQLSPFCSIAIIRFQFVSEQSKGLSENIYRGSPGSVFTRLQFHYRPMLSGGILTQKDAGESLFYDHYAGFLQWHDRQSRYKIILGNYQIQLAQGLVFATPFSNSKGMFPLTSLHPQGIKLSPFLSSNESDGFLGIAGQATFIHHAQLTLFHSNRTKDANLLDGQIKNIASSGYHRTGQELAGKDILRETSMGIGGSIYAQPYIAFGALMFVTRYKVLSDSQAILTNSILTDPVTDYLPAYIKGCSFFCNTSLAGLNTAAELATNNFQTLAQQFVLTYIQQDNEVGVKWWYIQKNFLSPFGKSFASSFSFPLAKNGLYLAASCSPQTNLSLSAYWTIEKDLWRTFFNPLPLSQKEFALQANYHADGTTILSAKYRFNERHHFSTDRHQTYTNCIYQVRLQVEKSVCPYIRIRCRWEKILLGQAHPLQGTNVYNDLDYHLSSTVNLQVRFSSFKLDDYLVHTYEYENDLPGVFSSYPVYAKGNKWYLLIKFRISTHLLFWFKYRRFYLDGVKSIGSGDELVNGDHKQEIRFQLNWEY